MIAPEDAAYARGWHEGEQSGMEIGRRQARGHIVAGIEERARIEEQQAMKAATVAMQSAAAANAAWLRKIAAQVRLGEL